MSPRLVLGLLALLALGGAGASSAQGVDDAGVGDVPRGVGVLTGEIVHQQGASGAGVEVLLYALPSSGAPGIRRATSDANRVFRFEGISEDPQTVYLVGARYRDIPFPGARVQFRPGQTEQHVKVRIGELSEDASALQIAELEMLVEWRGGDVVVTETYRVENGGEQVAHIGEARREAGAVLFTVALPERAKDLGSPFGLPLEGVARDGDTLRFFGPIYPSAWGGPFSERQEISLRYRLPSPETTFALEKPLPTGVGRVVVRGGAGFEDVDVSGATAEEIEGLQSWVLAGAALERGLSLRARFPEAQSDPSALTRRETRVFLELDGAALSVREEHFFHVGGNAPLLAPGEGALLALAIPRGARDLRFSPEASGWGLESDDGALRLRGPLPTGEQQFDVAYQLPRSARAVAYHFESEPAVPLLSVFVADTGLLIETERLHRRRPVQAGTRTYAHWEGFQIEANDRVRLVLRPLAGRDAAPRALISGTGAVFAALAALFLLAPFGKEREALRHESADPLRIEREALYAALRDLDHDHETGKVSDRDFASLRADLRGRVAAVFEREDAGTTPDSVTLPDYPLCAACGAMPGPEDRFCAQCGARLETTP